MKRVKKDVEKYVRKEYGFSFRALKIAKKKAKKIKRAREFLEMAEAYLNDSLYFLNKKDYIRAIACIYYAHAWLDAAARLGFLNLNRKEKKYFSVD
jgi:hypothetical protein